MKYIRIFLVIIGLLITAYGFAVNEVLLDLLIGPLLAIGASLFLKEAFLRTFRKGNTEW